MKMPTKPVKPQKALVKLPSKSTKDTYRVSYYDWNGKHILDKFPYSFSYADSSNSISYIALQELIEASGLNPACITLSADEPDEEGLHALYLEYEESFSDSALKFQEENYQANTVKAELAYAAALKQHQEDLHAYEIKIAEYQIFEATRKLEELRKLK